FVCGLTNYVLENHKYFRDYVVAYTNAATILTREFSDTEDLDGLFSGFDPEHRSYDWATWRYQGGEVEPASGARGVDLPSGARCGKRPAARHRVRVQPGLDPAHGGRAVHPDRGHPAGAARQHRPARRR